MKDGEDVRTANNVREQLREALSGDVSRLSHLWTFNWVPKTTTSPPTTLKLVLEGYRPNNAEGDNFQFAYSTDSISWTNINGALINSQLEGIFTLDLGQPAQQTGNIYIRVEDTNQASGTALDSVFVDYLVLRVE